MNEHFDIILALLLLVVTQDYKILTSFTICTCTLKFITNCIINYFSLFEVRRQRIVRISGVEGEGSVRVRKQGKSPHYSLEYCMS